MQWVVFRKQSWYVCMSKMLTFTLAWKTHEVAAAVASRERGSLLNLKRAPISIGNGRDDLYQGLLARTQYPHDWLQNLFSIINHVVHDHQPEKAQEGWNENSRRMTDDGRVGLGNTSISSILWLYLSRETEFPPSSIIEIPCSEVPISVATSPLVLIHSFRTICVDWYEVSGFRGIPTPLQKDQSLLTGLQKSINQFYLLPKSTKPVFN